jgi:hypothetical protein
VMAAAESPGSVSEAVVVAMNGRRSPRGMPRTSRTTSTPKFNYTCSPLRVIVI